MSVTFFALTGMFQDIKVFVIFELKKKKEMIIKITIMAKTGEEMYGKKNFLSLANTTARC